MRRAGLIAGAALGTLALGACESSQTKSARLERTGKGKAQLATLKVGAANASVRVSEKTVLTAASGNAVVVQLENTGPTDAVRVPIFLTVKDTAGQEVYRNDIDGLQTALQELAYLPAGKTAYWVNDQVLAPGGKPASVDVQVGKDKGRAAGAAPGVVLGPPKLDRDSTGPYATAQITNRSKIPQLNIPIFGVALKGGKVVAAGRGIVERLNPAPTKKPVFYKIFFVGSPAGARLQVATAPTTLTEGQTP